MATLQSRTRTAMNCAPPCLQAHHEHSFTAYAKIAKIGLRIRIRNSSSQPLSLSLTRALSPSPTRPPSRPPVRTVQFLRYSSLYWGKGDPSDCAKLPTGTLRATIATKTISKAQKPFVYPIDFDKLSRFVVYAILYLRDC